MKTKAVAGRRIFVRGESTGGYQEDTTDVHVDTPDEALTLGQHMAEPERECEDGADGYQPSVQVNYSLVHI